MPPKDNNPYGPAGFLTEDPELKLILENNQLGVANATDDIVFFEKLDGFTMRTIMRYLPPANLLDTWSVDAPTLNVMILGHEANIDQIMFDGKIQYGEHEHVGLSAFWIPTSLCSLQALERFDIYADKVDMRLENDKFWFRFDWDTAKVSA